MKLGSKIGRIGFVIGFLGPLFFYASPNSFFAYESRLLCPWCPYIDMFGATRLTWIQLGLEFGLISGLSLALIGFSIGFGVSKFVHSS